MRQEVFLIREVDDRGQRDRKKDSDDAENIAEDNDRGQDQKTGYTEGITKQLGLDHIAVQSLQNCRKTEEHQCVPWIDQQQDKSSDDSADNGTETGDQVCDTYDHGDQSDVLHSDRPHENGVCAADDDCVQDGEYDIPDQDIVAALEESDHVVVPPV